MYSPSYAGPVRPEAVLPDRALCLPTFSHFSMSIKLLSLWAGWGSIPVFFPPGWHVTRVSPYVRGPFPSKEIRISERDDPGPPVVPGGLGIGIPNPRKSESVIGPSCVLLKRVPQGRTESGGIVLAANAGPRAPSGGVTLKRRCTYRPSVIYLIVNKLLSRALSLSCTHTRERTNNCLMGKICCCDVIAII